MLSVIWNILGWNVRGLNAESKWTSIRNKIEESGASVVCLQETTKNLRLISVLSVTLLLAALINLLVFHPMGPLVAFGSLE